MKSYRKLASGLNGVPELANGDGFGVVASLGDVDGDGISDIAIGAPGTDGFGTDRGAIYILRMNADGTVKSSSSIDGSAAWNPASADGDSFGEDITVLGDIDGNGMPDLAVMSESIDSEDNAVTVVNILQLNIDGTVRQATRLVSDDGGDSALSNIKILSDIEAIGDIDGDGIGDLAVSGQEYVAPESFDDLTGLFSSINVINLLTLNSNGTVKNGTRIPGPDTGTSTFFTNWTSLAAIERANGTGELDLAVGIPFYGALFGFDGLVGVSSSLTILTLTPRIPNTAPPQTPVLNAIRSTSDQNPQISWPADRHADTYEIWLRNQTTGQVVLNAVSTTSNTFTPSVELGVGNYFVWVRAVNEVGKTSWSKPSTFVSKSAVSVIPTPDGMSRRPELKWQPLPGAAQYEIWLSDARTPSVAVVRKHIKSDSGTFALSEDLADCSYRFQVRGIAADGTTGVWSGVNQFSVSTKTTIEPVTKQFTLRPHIEWNPVAGAAAYDLYIRRLNSKDAPITLQVDAQNELSYVPSSGFAAGNYRVWVRPVGQDGKPGNWSAFTSFSSGIEANLAVEATEVKANQLVDFTISEMPEAKYLDVWIDDPAPGMTTAARGLSRHDFSTTLAHSFETQGKYRIWVRIVSEDGSTGLWSAPAEVIVRGRPGAVATENQLASTDRPRISWTPVLGAASYEIRVRNIDTDAIQAFTSRIGTSILNLTQPLPLGRYQTEVRAISQDGVEGEWATTNEPYVSQPVLTLQKLSQNADKTPQFQWNHVDGAANYDVVIRNVTTGRVEFAVRGIAATNYTSSVLPIGDFEFWVCANGPEQVRGEWSSMKFNIVEPKPFVVADGPGIPFGTTGQVFNWTFEVEADHYEVTIFSYAGVPALQNFEVTGTMYTLTSFLPRSGYRVWVRAVYADASKSPWSDPETFFVY